MLPWLPGWALQRKGCLPIWKMINLIDQWFLCLNFAFFFILQHMPLLYILCFLLPQTSLYIEKSQVKLSCRVWICIFAFKTALNYMLSHSTQYFHTHHHTDCERKLSILSKCLCFYSSHSLLGTIGRTIKGHTAASMRRIRFFAG